MARDLTALTLAQIENALDFCHETLDIEADADKFFDEADAVDRAFREEHRLKEEMRMEQQWRQHAFHENYRVSDLDAIFDKMIAGGDIRGPIRAIIEPDLCEVARVAIIFHTATVPTFSVLGNGKLYVSADGYRAGPAGDH